MKKFSFFSLAGFALPVLLLVPCVLRISRLSTPDLLPLLIGKWEVVFLWTTLCWLLITLFFISRSYCTDLKKILRKEWLVLLLIFLSGLFLRAEIAPRTHRLYFDEDIYLNIAQSIQSSNQAFGCNDGYSQFGRFYCAEPILNKEPSGWPFLLSLAFNFSANPEAAGRWLSIWLSSLTIVLVFLIGKEIGEGTAPLWSAGIYAAMPAPIQWAPTAEATTPFTFLLALCVLFLAKGIKEEKPAYFYPLYPLLALTAQIRPEAMLVFPLFLIVLLVGKGVSLLDNRNQVICWVFLLIVLIPHLAHLNLDRHENWGNDKGPMLSVRYVGENLFHNLRFFVEAQRFPLIDTILILLGAGAVGKNRLSVSALFPWLLVFFGLYLFFYAGSYDYGVDFRYSLPVHVPLALLAGSGAFFVSRFSPKINFLGEAVVVGLVFFFLFFQLPGIRTIGEEGWQARTDHDFITQTLQELPANAVIFCRTPSEILAGGGSAIQSWRMGDKALLSSLRKEGKQPYFYFDAWCSTPEFKQECGGILKGFNLQPVAKTTVRSQQFILFKLKEGKNAG